MKKTHIAALVAAATIMVVGLSCSGPKYSDAVAVNKSFVDAMQVYLNDMEKANSAQEVADALDSFATKVEKIAPRMKEISKKYPELKDPKRQPEELKAIRQQSTALGKKMGGIMMKLMQYRDDPGVKTAQMHLQKAMSLMM
jgi:hypothetical protein